MRILYFLKNMIYNVSRSEKMRCIKMDKLKAWIYKCMVGRYGNDHLNAFLMLIALVVAIINALFFRKVEIVNIILSAIVWILLIINIFRSMSKKVYRRQIENANFLKMMAPYRKYWNLAKRQAADKDHKYFMCPKCGQNVRVPKGRGKITITCPSCRTKFDRKS